MERGQPSQIGRGDFHDGLTTKDDDACQIIGRFVAEGVGDEFVGSVAGVGVHAFGDVHDENGADMRRHSDELSTC
jgi:hypothetical protein